MFHTFIEGCHATTSWDIRLFHNNDIKNDSNLDEIREMSGGTDDINALVPANLNEIIDT